MFRTTLALLFALTLSVTANAQLIWSEEFDSGSAPNESIWSYDLGASGWGNQELQEYTNSTDNVAVVDGNLRIRVRNDDRGSGAPPFTSGRIKTENKLTFQYGTIEARIKVPDLANGLWPAFWTLGNNFGQVGWPFCGEIDVLEMGDREAIDDGVVNRRVLSTAHWDNDGNYANYGLRRTFDENLTDDFHVYRMEWTPNTIITYVDGLKVWEIDIRPNSCTSCTEFHQPHFFILNVAVGGTFPNYFSADQISAPLPAEMLVDYVRVFDNGHTIMGGSGYVATTPETPDLGPAHSGSWYNADQSGHGFSMEFGEANDGSPVAVVYWYTYDSIGNPIFFVGTGTPDANGVDLAFQSPVGMAFGVFDPESVERNDAGTGRLDFSDTSTGIFSYNPSAFSISNWGHAEITELPLTKLFGIPTAGSTATQ